MGARHEGPHVNVILVIAAACVLVPLRIQGASGPGGRPQVVGGSWPSVVPDDMGLILRRLKSLFATPNFPNYQHDTREPNYAHAHEYLASMAEDGSWPDIDYRSGKNGWNNMHLGRMARMASAYAEAASPDYHSPQMLEAAERALQCWFKRRQPILSLWWENTIGQPLLLARTLVPLEDVLPAQLLRQGLTYFTCPMDVDPHYATGENLVWFAQQQLLRGALARSADDVAAASADIQREIRISTLEGIQRDLSFHQHGMQLYNGGYGHDFMVDTCEYASVLAGTRFAFSHEKLMLLADHLLKGSGHMIRGKMLDYSAFGRTITRQGSEEGAVDFERSCDQLAALLPERAAELAALKKHIEGSGAPYSYLGNTYFWNSDFMTHQREGYYTSVKMVSNRTVGTEIFGGENVQGCWLPFGANWIVRRGDEYDYLFPVMDWARLPGVTSPHVIIPPPRNIYQQEPFVGGVSDGTYGAAAMVFDESETQPLVPHFTPRTWGQKAWFFFDREIVALGAGIGSSQDEPINTTLNQTRLRGAVLLDGRKIEPGELKLGQSAWVLHDAIGYALLGPGDATLQLGPRTGSWKAITTGASDAPVTDQVFTLWIDHGVRPRDAQYAYAVIPGMDAQQMAKWTAHPPVRIIVNTTAQQAVEDVDGGVTEIVYRQPGRISVATGWTVKVDHSCLALLVKHGTSMRVAVSSPGGEFPFVHLTLSTPQGEKRLTFELPSGDRAGKSQVKDVSGM